MQGLERSFSGSNMGVPIFLKHFSEDNRMDSERVVQVQVAHDDKEALNAMIAVLVDERLIACGQLVGPISSTFVWEGSTQSTQEWLALLKTSERALDRLVARVAEMHSYDVPEILVIEVAGGYEPYLKWVSERTTL
jgi:periplasmic divalent cation tolerance protein